MKKDDGQNVKDMYREKNIRDEAGELSHREPEENASDVAEGMEELRKAYESIRIPEELRTKVMAAIEEGKSRTEEKKDSSHESTASISRERNRRKGGSRMKNILTRTGQTAAAVFIAITVLANSGAGVAYAMEQIPVIGAITKVVTFRTYEKKEGKSEAEIKVPVVEAESGSGMGNATEQLNRSVKEYTDRLIAQFEVDVKAENGEGFKAVYSDYEVLADNDSLFTLRINTDEIMASGAQSVKIYNIDKKTDRILTLKDLFPIGNDYITLISDAIKFKMQEEMNSDEGRIYFLNDGMEDDFKSIREDQNFYINSSGHLVIVFDEYEVAPGSMGIVEMELPETVYRFQN